MNWLKSAYDMLGDMLTQITAVVSVLILIALFFLFDFLFLFRATRMLYHLFHRKNLPWWLVILIPWKIKKIDLKDRKERYRYLKSFCEYAIFVSRGEKLSRRGWWKCYRTYFLEHLITSPFQITLDSSFDILKTEVDELIKDYFQFLGKHSQGYLHNPKASKFTSVLCFENGFVYLSSFMNGLERKFSDSWTDLMVKYNHTLKNAKYQQTKNMGSIINSIQLHTHQNFITSANEAPLAIDNNELFMIYSWLMWSPSYQMDFPQNKFKIILYGIGDESNTVNLVVDNSANSQELWRQVLQAKQHHTYGFSLGIKCELHEFVPYVRNHMASFGTENLPLINNLMNNANDTHYILSYSGPADAADLHNSILMNDDDAFFSGYLWALFGKYKKGETKFEVKNAAVFFEHTNLANQTSIEYFTKSMAQKTITHFQRVLEPNLPYKYCLNGTVSAPFRKQYIKLLNEILPTCDKNFQKLFKKYVNLEDNHVTINEILENIDEEFPLNEFEFKKVTTPGEIGRFYTDVYVKNFSADERDSIDDLVYRTLQLKSANHHDIILAFQGDIVVGGIVFDWFKKSNTGLIEYIVVDSKFRGMRIAQKLVAKATAQLTNYSKKPLNAIFIEIEDPEKMQDLDAQAAVVNYRRLQLWCHNKYQRLDLNYVQPALGLGQEKLENLMLAVNTLRSDSETIPAAIVKDFLIDFNEICNRIPDVYDPQYGVKGMLDELDAKPDGQVKILKDSINFEKYRPKKIKK